MAKRSIADDEIALIKAMLAREMKNKDIQFFFNRPDRPVNSGRITGIRDGTYGPSKDIDPASVAELDDFIAGHSAIPGVAAVAIPASTEDIDPDPLIGSALKKLFRKGKDKRWRLAAGETDAHECKTSFGFRHTGAWLRAIAALANNTGGYILFGVHDKGVSDENGEDLSYVAAGMTTDEFEKMDPAEISKRVKAVFDPTPRVRTKLLSLDGARVGVIYVERHESRPVIATKTEGSDVREGDIYFRYPGQSTRIKYSDLRALLDARDRDARAQVLPMVERLLQLGPERTMIADLAGGTLDDGKRAIQIDEALIEKLNFIKEGEFSEAVGAPTLRLIGEVQPVGAALALRTKLSLLTRAAVFDAFLDQTNPTDPEQYIRFAVEVGQGEWYPLHYFAKLAGMTRAQLVEFINASGGTPSRKATYTKRVQPNAAYKEAIGKPKAFLEDLLARKPITVVTPEEASHVSQGIWALPDGFTVDVKPMMWLLKQCMFALNGKSTLSFARRAAGRVDELLFSDETAAAKT